MDGRARARGLSQVLQRSQGRRVTKMGAKPPWKDIPDSNLLPAGVYEFTVKELAETTTKATEDKVAKLMYVAQLKVVEPKEYRGQVLFDRFTIGNEDDPDASDPET